MKIYDAHIKTISLAAAFCLCAAGCRDGGPKAVIGGSRTACFVPNGIHIAGLTAITEKDQGHFVRAVIEVQDGFGSRMKAPGRFRFELYQYQARSGQVKGKRLVIWPDFDLDDQTQNNQRWRDFLRAYEFALPLTDIPATRPLVLEATFITGQHRLSDVYIIN